MKEEIEDILMNSYDNFGFFDEAKATKELLNLFSVSQQRELFVKEQGKWLIANTSLSVEQIIDFEMEFINK